MPKLDFRKLIGYVALSVTVAAVIIFGSQLFGTDVPDDPTSSLSEVEEALLTDSRVVTYDPVDRFLMYGSSACSTVIGVPDVDVTDVLRGEGDAVEAMIREGEWVPVNSDQYVEFVCGPLTVGGGAIDGIADSEGLPFPEN